MLNDRQKIYAATDAWACLMIYRYMENLRQTGDYQIEEKKIETIVKEEHGV